jgi:nicotinate-nucleotide pyrophosphorylase (carboxylating)
MDTPALDPDVVRRLVAAALAEDRADNDVTTAALVPPDQQGRAVLIAKEEGVLAGLAFARLAFEAVDASLKWQAASADGNPLAPGDCIARVEGALASILRAERVALNFVSHLSGVATAAHNVVRALEGTSCRLRDTRKTTPGLRLAEKYAVRVGGGDNHRLDLADGVLIKDNHLAAVRARGLTIADAVRLARERNTDAKIEVEVTNAEEAREAIAANAEEILLDNMALDAMREVVRLARAHNPPPKLEASGGITLENVREVAGTGVDYISMGEVTHSASALDMSLEVELT